MNRCIIGFAALLLAACASVAGEDDIVLVRKDQSARFRLTVESDEGRGPQRVVAEFDLVRTPTGEQVVLLDVRRGPVEKDARPIAVDDEARRAFGGDPGPNGVIGRFALPVESIDALVPPGIPEPVFGVVTDLCALLAVQSSGFGVDRLHTEGDHVTFGPFTESWRRPPATVDARIECAGGTTMLEQVRDGRAVLVWTPDPFHLAIVRKNPISGAPILLAGVETLVVEVQCDPNDGALLGARSRVDRLDMRLWTSAVPDVAPGAAEVPAAGGLAIVIERSLVLERVTADPASNPRSP